MLERVGKKIMRIQRNGKDILNIANRGRLVYTHGDTTPQMVLVCQVAGQLNLASNIDRYGITGMIDWGDGSDPTHWEPGSSFSRFHTYAAAGEYRVTITGTIAWKEASESDYYNGSSSLPKHLKRIELPTGISPIRSKTSRAFRNFIYLENIPAGLYNHIPSENDFSYDFYNCRIKEIPPNLFKLCKSGKYFSYTFAGNDLEAIPENLFKHIAPMYLDGCFARNSGITGKLPELWNTPRSISTYEGCYEGCVNASNYADAVAAGWA